MNNKVVTVEISEDGSASIDLSGFNGKSCDRVAREFIGSDKVRLERKKREYSMVETQSQKVVAKS